MADSGNGSKPPQMEQPDLLGEEEQTDLLGEEEQQAARVEEQQAAGDESAAEEPPAPLVTELANTSEGCWKVLADGKRVKLDDEQWRKELARALSHQSAGA